MPVVTHRPPAPLRPFVAVAHGYRVPAAPTGLHRGLPSRHLTLVLELAGPLRVRGERGDVAAHGVVGGLHTAPALIDASRPQDGVQYALTPLGARALLGAGAAELRGEVLDLTDLLGPGATDLLEQVAGGRSWYERFALVDALLLRRLSEGRHRAPPEVAEAWRLVLASSGAVTVSAVAQHVGWSRRHLSERFREWTGLTPKEAARVARFELARALLAGEAPGRVADVAARAGYADQSHLAREWRALAGCSVTTWLREELPYVQDEASGAGADSPA